MKIRNLPKLHLADLLRRRKMTLTQFINESGIVAYGALVERCTALGVQPPEEAEYNVIVPQPISSQQDGVIVLEPPPPVDDLPEEIVFIPPDEQPNLFDLDAQPVKKKKNKGHS